MKLLILYEELADYFLACIEMLMAKHNVEVHIIHKEKNAEAPFNFKRPIKSTLYNRDKMTFDRVVELSSTLAPDAIFCAGWTNKWYLKICEDFKNKIPVWVGFDNKWEGNIKQYIASFLSPFLIKKYFDYCFIPGLAQKKFAQKLGFNESEIYTGAYSADVNLFHAYYEKFKLSKKEKFPKRFIYVGRYVEHKGIKDLWNAFIAAEAETPNDWELWCLGTGNIPPLEHHKIKHFGFVQPNQLEEFIKNTGVFILPSLFEPWGVVVHEFAAAGFPLICSTDVGAAEMFLGNLENGYLFNSGDVPELKKLLIKTMQMDTQQMITMGACSVEKSLKVTPESWSDTVMNMMLRNSPKH